MPLDGLTCRLLSQELDDALRGTRIDKVFQPDKYNIFLHMRTSSGNKKLLVSYDPTSPRVHFTETSRENPLMPPSFCMLLRKHMQGAKITGVTCPDYERIIEIGFTTIDELHDTKEMRLIVELMGRYSNVILVNSNGRIIDSAIHVDFSINRVREVMPARMYEYPPAQNKINADKAIEILDQGDLPILEEESMRPISKALLNSVKGISPLLVNLVLNDCDIDGKTPIKNIDDTTSLRNSLGGLLRSVTTRNITPCATFTEKNDACEYTFTKLNGYEKTRQFDTISEAIDAFYNAKFSNIDFENKRRALLAVVNNALMHASKKYEIHKNDYDDGMKADEYKKYGDLILCYAYMVKDKSDSLTCQDVYDELLHDVTIPLDPSLNAVDNAQEYFKRFRKSKRKAEMSEQYLKDDEQAISYLRSLKTAITAADQIEDIEALEEEIKSEIVKDTEKKVKEKPNGDPNRTVGKSKSGKASSRALRNAAKIAQAKKGKNKNKAKNEKPLTYRHFYTSDGYECFCGRNNIQNDRLTFGTANKDDWWFHVKDMPGTHVILKSHVGEEFPSDAAVTEAAQAAAFYSRQTIIEEHQGQKDALTGGIKAEIDYCPVSHVKKIPKAKPGMVIYEQYYSIFVEAKEPNLKSGDSDINS